MEAIAVQQSDLELSGVPMDERRSSKDQDAVGQDRSQQCTERKERDTICLHRGSACALWETLRKEKETEMK